MTKAQRRKVKAVAYLKHYFGTYADQPGFSDYRTKTLIDDVLYGLGMALDKKKYEGYDGFALFKNRLRRHLKKKA